MKIDHTLVGKIAKNVGFPFGIRATSQQYNNEVTIPSGKSGAQGINEGSKNVTHFFIIDKKALDLIDLSEVDDRLETTVNMAISEYALQHADNTHFD